MIEQRNGIFRLEHISIDLAKRELRISERPIQITSRAFDVLQVLLCAGGAVVTKSDFEERIWEGSVVQENTLQVHISTIRRALSGQVPIIRTVSGRGYQLVGPWQFFAKRATLKDCPPDTVWAMSPNLPSRTNSIVGRDEMIDLIAVQIRETRFVSLIGPGGVGKSAVAISVAYRLLDELVHGAYFIDLGAVRDPSIIPQMAASVIGIIPRSGNALDDLVESLIPASVLLILDTCEHVIETAATLTDRIFKNCANVHILVTSREPLRVEGECAHAVAPLTLPSDRASLTATEIVALPAVRLFIDRFVSGDRQPLAADIPVSLTATICEAVDGLPLALEIASAYCASHGVADAQMTVEGASILGALAYRRSIPRHKTLTDSLDWSYNPLTSVEQSIFRRLSVFRNAFDGLYPVTRVASAGIDIGSAARAFEKLVAKSLVEADFSTSTPRYRLLKTTRLYAHLKLSESGELADVLRSYALFVLESLTQTASPNQADAIDDVRYIIERIASDDYNWTLRTDIIVKAAPIFNSSVLRSEWISWALSASKYFEGDCKKSGRAVALNAAICEATLLIDRGDASF